MQTRKWENEYRTTVVCIDRYENRVPVGRFYNQYCPEGVRFQGVIELLRGMEDMLDQMRFPQPFSRVRSFGEALNLDREIPDGSYSHEGELATFAIKVLFRQNASWQGTVSWLEGRMEESFRSVLELILLMDSALAGEQGESAC